MTVDFDAIPRSVVDGGSVRFFPRTDPVKPISAYAWDFGDGDTSTDATPIHVYAGTGSYATYDVNLTITYADTTHEHATEKVSFIASDLAANVPDVVADGSHIATSVFLYDNKSATKYMLVNRLAWAGSHYYLQNPTVTSSIDVIGTARFTLIDPGDSTADEQSLVAEGINVIIIMGKSVIFSGVVRRVTNSVQAAFLATVKIRVWDFECDSDLIRLQKTNVTSSALVTGGAALYDSPGYLARRILKPAGTRDSRGVINCVDAKMSYQLNSSTVAESVGNQNDHLTTVHAQTNYDLRSRPDYLIYPYTSFDGSAIVTNSGADWAVDEFIGDYIFLVSRGVSTTKVFTTNFAVSTSEILVGTASTFFSVNDRVIPSTDDTLPTGLTAIIYYVKTVTADHLTLSTSIGGATVTFSTNGTGTHSLILVAETAGVTTYGKITDNDATTITATLVGASTAPTTLGYFIIYRGYLIDFAHDISPPSALTNLDVNKTCFEYSDNDDKRKLSTKIVATGKDFQGKTISVAVAGVHAYDETKQFFSDSTFVSKLSEGYVYKNSYINAIFSCTAIIPQSGKAVTKTNLSTDTTGITLPASQAGFLVNQEVTFSAPPRPLVAGTVYFVSDHTGDVIKVSATQGGGNITLLANLRTYAAQWSIASSASGAGNITVTIKGVVAAIVPINNGELDHISAVKVSNALNGYVDANGCVWTVTSDGTYPYMDFSTTDSAYAGTMIAYDMGTTGQAATEESSSTAAISCTASTPAQMQVDNSKGLFQKGTAIVFKATTMPSGGLTAGTVYTVKNDGVNLSGFCFCVMSGGSQMSWSDTGTAVKVYRSVDVINRNTSGTSSVWLYGSGFSIDTTLTYCLLNPYGTYDNVTLSDTGTVQIASDGIVITQFLLLESTLPASSDSDYGGKGFFMSPRLYVDNHSRIGGNYEVLIGEETVTITARNNDTTYGNYIDIGAASARITSASKKCYPHGVGALVARNDTYTEASPQAGSPIALYGLYIDYRTVDANITYGQLDAYATSLLLGLGNFYGKATTWSPLEYAVVKQTGEFYGSAQTSRSRPIMIGDSITITNFDGDTPSKPYEVVETTIICNEGRMKMQLGDFEKNAYTTLMSNTNAINNTLT